MKLIKTYLCDDNTPTRFELEDALEIAKNEHCIINLEWIFPMSGKYSMMIDETMNVEDMELSLPNCYPV